MRRKEREWLLARSRTLQRQRPIHETLLMKIGTAQ
jgi:hypothetical protein